MERSDEERRANKAQTRELYERDTTLRDSAVDSLRAKIEKGSLPACATRLKEDRELLLQFLRTKAYDEPAALACFVNFCAFEQHHGWFSRPSAGFDHGVYSVGGRARTGSRLVRMHVGNIKVDAPDTSIESLQFAGFKMLQGLIRQDEPTKTQGAFFLVDFRGFSLSLMRRVTVADVKRGLSMFQDTFPIRIDKILLINEPLWISALYSSMCPQVPTHVPAGAHEFITEQEIALRRIKEARFEAVDRTL